MSLILKNHPKSRILSHIYVIMFVDYIVPSFSYRDDFFGQCMFIDKFDMNSVLYIDNISFMCALVNLFNRICTGLIQCIDELLKNVLHVA